jgi:hypothetical protein
MQKLIDTSTAFYGAGNSATKKLFTISSGSYSGREIVVYSTSPSTITFSYADAPYTSWASPQTIAGNAADYPASAWMDANGDIYVVYSAQTSLDLLFRKLTFNAGNWTVGSEVVIYGDKDNYFPSILKDASGKLTVCWSCYDATAGTYTLRGKQSSNGGVQWGGGSSDAGAALTSGSSGCFAQLVYLPPYIYAFYTDGGTKLAYRYIADGGAFWEGESTLFTGTGLADSLSAAVSESGAVIGVAFNGSGKTWFLEYDTANWSGLHELATSPATSPLLLYNGVVPHVIYGIAVGNGQTELKYRCKSGVGFVAECNLAAELERFKYVLLYDADGSPNWQNLTTAAGNGSVADVSHPSSNRLIQSVNDAIYLGADDKFAVCNIILSTAGDSSGAVSWAYWHGSSWATFTPTSGGYNFDQTSKRVRLWNDSVSAPADWQKTTVDLKTAYWIKVTVSSAFSVAPVGSQLTPLTDINYLNR